MYISTFFFKSRTFLHFKTSCKYIFYPFQFGPIKYLFLIFYFLIFKEPFSIAASETKIRVGSATSKLLRFYVLKKKYWRRPKTV